MTKRPSDLTIAELTKFGSEAAVAAAQKAKLRGVKLTGRVPIEIGKAVLVRSSKSSVKIHSAGQKVAS